MVYIVVAYIYTFNAILLCPTESQEDANMVEAFTSIFSNLEAIVHKPTLHVLNNECSRAVQNLSKIKNTVRQNVEAHHYDDNAAEPAVTCTKYHIISHIATMDASCLIQLWSEMIP